MSVLKFKTSINCGGCVAKVKKSFDTYPAIKSWDVDTNNPDKLLTIETDTLQPDQIIDALAKIGYRAELL